jgi:hypothetical protein
VLAGRSGKSVVVTSNLQRAIETAAIALWGRLQRTGEQVHVLSDLQEVSRNVDTMSLSDSAGLPPLLTLRDALAAPAFDPAKLLEAPCRVPSPVLSGHAASRAPACTRVPRRAPAGGSGGGADAARGGGGAGVGEPGAEACAGEGARAHPALRGMVL